jgi:hypothetical protein
VRSRLVFDQNHSHPSSELKKVPGPAERPAARDKSGGSVGRYDREAVRVELDDHIETSHYTGAPTCLSITWLHDHVGVFIPRGLLAQLRFPEPDT